MFYRVYYRINDEPEVKHKDIDPAMASGQPMEVLPAGEDTITVLDFGTIAVDFDGNEHFISHMTRKPE